MGNYEERNGNEKVKWERMDRLDRSNQDLFMLKNISLFLFWTVPNKIKDTFTNSGILSTRKTRNLQIAGRTEMYYPTDQNTMTR
jgi:hypothetical protein